MPTALTCSQGEFASAQECWQIEQNELQERVRVLTAAQQVRRDAPHAAKDACARAASSGGLRGPAPHPHEEGRPQEW